MIPETVAASGDIYIDTRTTASGDQQFFNLMKINFGNIKAMNGGCSFLRQRHKKNAFTIRCFPVRWEPLIARDI
jgi:hypothetical protein